MSTNSKWISVNHSESGNVQHRSTLVLCGVGLHMLEVFCLQTEQETQIGHYLYTSLLCFWNPSTAILNMPYDHWTKLYQPLPKTQLYQVKLGTTTEPKISQSYIHFTVRPITWRHSKEEVKELGIRICYQSCLTITKVCFKSKLQ
jgi:hypothetical protein